LFLWDLTPTNILGFKLGALAVMVQLILGFKDLNLMKWKCIVAPQAKKSESTFNNVRKHRFGVL
tara:strand:- start:153 stop:344 length:192 start_codon:yes stop_codon:yes gene_type:complete